MNMNDSASRKWFVLICIITAIILLPRILALLIQFFIASALATAIILLSQCILRMVGVKVNIPELKERLFSRIKQQMHTIRSGDKE